MDALLNAIRSSDDPEAEKDLERAKSFYPAVMRHLDFKYTTEPGEVYGDDEIGMRLFEEARTRAHNDVIKCLNDLNDLARKYHVRPFTVRNFLPSDVRSKKSQTEAVSKIMRYDRDIIEEYYDIAFSSDVQKRKATFDRYNF